MQKIGIIFYYTIDFHLCLLQVRESATSASTVKGGSPLAIQRVRSKWEKTKVLLLSEPLMERIPDTRRWSAVKLNAMLNEYGMVYVKPDQGTFGLGVVRVEKLSDDTYRYQSGSKVHRFATFDAMSESLQKRIGVRRYLIQKGISLLTYKGLRFDIRVMVQQNPRHDWETTGIIGRVSHPDKIVTNYHSGGVPMAFERLMHPHMMQDQSILALKSRLETLGTDVARQLHSHYPGLKEIGIDVALDAAFEPWILEVNTLPDPFIFRKLEDKTVFRRIYRYCLAYKRRMK